MAIATLSRTEAIRRTPAILGPRPAGWSAGEEEAIPTNVVFEEEIFPPDDRRLILDPKALPFRFICCLEMTQRGVGGRGTIPLRGSGVLISPRHVLTAGHNVLDNMQRFDRRLGRSRAAAIQVSPGRHLRAFNFGRSPATRMRVPDEWNRNLNNEFDFALLTLRDDLGSSTHESLGGQALGFWGDPARGGDTRIRALAPERLREHSANLSGYPSDKCGGQPGNGGMTQAQVTGCTRADRGRATLQGSTQWRTFGRIVDPSPAGLERTIAYDLDTAPGHSGGPVWIRWTDYRNLIAINTTGLPAATAPFAIVASLGVRITEDVLTQLRTWMREDGASATF